MLTILTSSIWYKLLYSDSSPERTLNEGSKKRTQELEEKANRLAEKMGVHKRIELIEHPKYTDWKAIGKNSSGRSGICVDQGIFDSSTWVYYLPETIPFTLSHEIAHIKNNDDFYFFLIPVITAIATFIFLGFYLPILPTYFVINIILSDVIGLLAWHVSLIVTSRIAELNADLEACKYTTDAEKTGFINEIKILQMKQLLYRNEKNISFLEGLKRKIIVDSMGNNRFDLFHPLLSTRIQKIEATMKIKPDPIDPRTYFLKKFRNDTRIPFLEHRKRIRERDETGYLRSKSSVIFENRKEYLKMPFYPLLWLKYNYL